MEVRRTLSTLGILPALALLLGARTASAEETPRARLAYVHDASIERCPTERELRDSVAARLGYDPFAGASSEEPRQVVVQVRKRGSGIIGTLETFGPSPGQKELSSPSSDCRELVDALAVAIALAINPGSLSRPAVPPPAPPAPLPPPSPPPIALPPADAPSPSPAPADRSADALSVVVGAGPRVLVNELPSLVPAAAVHVGLRWKWLAPRVEGVGSLAGSDSASGGGAVSASLLAGSLLMCAHGGMFYGCAGMTLGSIRAEGTGVLAPQQGSDLYASADLRGGIEIAISRAFAVQLHIELAAPLTRVALQLDGRDVWTVPSIGARSGASAVFRF